jgi:cytochrome c5
MMNRWNLFLIILVIAAVIGISLTAAGELDGKRLFHSNKCSMCHSVSSANIKAKITTGKSAGGDLTDVSKKHKGNWILNFLRGEETLNDQPHLQKFKGTDEELQALVDWLLEQKAE